MYQSFFRLRESPFELSPDPRFLYYTDSHREGFSQMRMGIELRKGFIMLTGEVGTGKTTLLRALVREFRPDVRYAMIFHTLFSAKGMFQNICREFGLEVSPAGSKSDYVMQLYEFLRAKSQTDLTSPAISNAVVIIDEAHNLEPEILEELRLLSNFEGDDKKLLQILLVGQPELLMTLARQDMRQLNQRIGLRFSLRRFTPEESAGYVQHRLRIAGHQEERELFTAGALQSLHERSEGIPRRINILCENALMLCSVRREPVVTEQVVAEVDSEDFFTEMNEILSEQKRGQAEVGQTGNSRFIDYEFSRVDTTVDGVEEVFEPVAEPEARGADTAEETPRAGPAPSRPPERSAAPKTDPPSTTPEAPPAFDVDRLAADISERVRNEFKPPSLPARRFDTNTMLVLAVVVLNLIMLALIAFKFL